jgi:glutaredoxin-like YruB-family protein
MKSVSSFAEFTSWVSVPDKSFLLLYKSGSPVSDCAVNALKEAYGTNPEGYQVGLANVSDVRDIHPNFAINSVPSLLFFEKGKHINTVKGCLTSGNYKSILENAAFQSKTASEGKPAKNVTVYSTPTCSWCTTLKAWLRKNNVYFTDVDVSRDQHAAEELVRRSGQQGVPQTEINGQIVVGFNQQRLKELLEIQ